MKWIAKLFIVVSLVTLFLPACAIDREFQVGLTYWPSTALRSYYTFKEPPSIALAPFTDNRAERKLLFKRYNNLGGEDFYYLRGERLDTEFAASIKRGLEEAGVKVIDIPSWDRSADGFTAMTVNGILTGTIEEFSCKREVGASPLLPALVGKARVRLYWGDKQGRLIKEDILEANFQSEEFLFIAEAEIEHILNLVMADLVEKTVKSKAVSEIIKGNL